MKKQLVLFYLAQFFFQNLYSQNNGRDFIINGIVKGRDTGVIYLQYLDLHNKRIYDTTILKNGRFEFTGKISQLSYATIYGRKKIVNNNQVNFISFLLDPGELEVELTQDDDNKAVFTKSKSQNLFNLYYNALYTLKERYALIDKSLIQMKALYIADTSKKVLKGSVDSLNLILISASAAYDSFTLAFVLKHRNEYIAPFLLQNLVVNMSVESLQPVFRRFSSKIRKSRYGLMVEKEIELKKGWTLGKKANNFITKDMYDSKIELSEYNGNKVILLDFWASWCVPCRKGSPNLIKWYNAYHNKGFEIIGIANDDTRRQAWLKAIETDGTGAWKHVLQGVGTVNDIGKLYAVQPIPDKILIDKNGIIIYRQVGDDDRGLEKKLRELFEK